MESFKKKEPHMGERKWTVGGVEEWWERNPQQSLVKLHNKVLSSLTVVYETTDWQRAFERLHFKNVKMR